MAPLCPTCSTQLKDEYGMATCPSCGAIIFIDIDGLAQAAAEAPETSASLEISENSEIVFASPSEPSNEPTNDLNMNDFLGYAPVSQDDPNDPLGLSAYANSEVSSAQNGPLVVTLIISGIDAKDLRDEIRQALQDSRFGWDTAALMSSIKGGILQISKVSPVKATIIINRIKNLSVRIRWEQNAITEIDPIDPKI